MKLVRINTIFSIDHEIKARYAKIIGHRNMSNDVEEYMKSRVEEYEKIKNIVAPNQGTTTNNSESSNFNSNSNLKSVIMQQENITLDLLNDSKIDLSLNTNKLENKTLLCKVKANAHMVESIANTRIQRIRMT
jgi:hypothetical protein